MTKTILVTNLNEVKQIKISCGSCNYAMLLPVKKWIESNVQLCPVCKGRFPVEGIKNFAVTLGSLQENLKDNENFSKITVEIETEETR